ncbi:MAG: hemerythrin domain-containing protein, partial [Candidatus Zixiibacteriota bacterium]
MEAVGIPKEQGPIGAMLAEHDMGRSYVKGMSQAAADYRQGKQESHTQFVQNARSYVRLLSQHILKENNVLFPMANKNLSDAQQKKLLEDFEQVEHHRTGKGTHEKLLAMLQNLKKTYWP